MLPETTTQEYLHRKYKRQLEIELFVEALKAFLKQRSDLTSENITILEFGAGDGFQVPYLKTIGRLIASDIYTSSGIKSLGKNVDFVECSITDMPFRDAQFDIVFANQVIPDLNDLTHSFREAQRIGKPSTIYAFSVATSLWLMLSIPALYYNKIRYGVQSYEIDSKLKKFLRIILPEGRGRWNFLECYRHYRIKNWKRLFHDNGFFVIGPKPLLLYGPSELPIIPTSVSKTNLCSSVLFLLKKRENQ